MMNDPLSEQVDVHGFIYIYIFAIPEADLFREGVRGHLSPGRCQALARYGWVDRKRSAPAGFLPLDHPKLIAHRHQVRIITETQGVHPRLILNYDQVYRIRYRGRGSNMTKTRASPGEQVCQEATQKRKARIVEDMTGQAWRSFTAEVFLHLYMFIVYCPGSYIYVYRRPLYISSRFQIACATRP